MNSQPTAEGKTMRKKLASGVLLRRCRVVLAAAVCAVVLGAPAQAATPAAGWSIHSYALPSSFSAGDDTRCLSTPDLSIAKEPLCDAYEVTARNAGGVATDGSTVTLTDTLPAGVTVRKVEFIWTGLPEEDGGTNVNLVGLGFCTETNPVRCQLPTGERGFPPVEPDDVLKMVVYVTVDPGTAGQLRNAASVSGGGAPEASTAAVNAVDGNVLFSATSLASSITGVDGAPEEQAGAHPYELTTRIDLANEFKTDPEGGFNPEGGSSIASIQDLKDAVVDLPLGFLGTALSTPKCTFTQLSGGGAGGSGAKPGCPADTRLGNIVAYPGATEPRGTGIYDLVPERGVAAEFGFVDVLKGSHVLRARVAPTPSGYVLRTIGPEIPQATLAGIEVVLYGNPAVKDGSPSNPVPLFTNPADCSGQPLVTHLYTDSWQNPGRFNTDGSPDLSDPAWASAASESPPVTGCNRLRFEPSLRVQPETSMADSPTGLSVIVDVPQSEEPATLATPPLRDASVTLPAGLTIDPSAATGLAACSEAQIALGSSAPPACPESSKIGTVEVRTPLVEGVLPGSIYLAAQNENPFHSLLAGYIVVDDPITGTLIKVPGNLTPDPGTGQITGSFRESPQFPFSELRLHFSGGARGELATPTGCGSHTTMSDLMPWSAPDSGPDATPSDSFLIDSGCVTGFTPGFVAGSTNTQAGGYSPFTLQLSRSDGDENLAGLSVTLPPGLLGKIAGIPLCSDGDASAGTCPAASQVGSVEVGAGVGPNPLFVSGKAYLTGPYNGGPYGLVVQVPAVAGPFDLGVVSVRQSLRIDPHTAQVTDVSDAFPTILDGLPLRVRQVDVNLDRPGFTFNPTNCTPMAITGNVSSTQGASSVIASRFQAGGCRELPFKPSFKVSTQARTSKKNGASLDVKVGYPAGSQANIRSAAVTLPKQLPSRLTTIQQACLAAVFDANPASCPAGSDIGTVTARTPVLAGPLTGPAYLVSHGGAAFPDLVVVLQGENITLDLVGSINIKHGVTSSAFNSVPDAPISSFELKLPEGPHSGLAAVVPAKAKGNLCGIPHGGGQASLVMPTMLTGQNGAVLKQNTKITVTGCPKAKKKTTGRKRHKRVAAKKGK